MLPRVETRYAVLGGELGLAGCGRRVRPALSGAAKFQAANLPESMGDPAMSGTVRKGEENADQLHVNQ